MTTHVQSPRLIGREAESRLLDEVCAQVRAGGVATALVGGEAGVGKSRLVTEFLARAAAASATRVLVGGCVELGADGLPFAPFVAALRGIVPELDDAERARLAPLLPGLGTPGGPVDEQSRPRLFEGVLALLARLAAERPTLLVLEDAHWADRSSLDLLDFLVRNQQAAPGSLVVVTHRSDEPGSRGLRVLLAGLGRLGRIHRITPGPLSRGEVAAQAGAILGHPADPGLLAVVHRRSDGNPLFVEALVCVESLLDDPHVLPGSLAFLLATRVDRLGPEAAAVVRAAAVGGLQVRHTVLAAVCATSSSGIDEPLRAAVDAGILVVEGDGYRFRHALIRDAVLDRVLPGERAALHGRYAEVLRAAGGDPAELSHHLTGAGDGPGAVVAAWEAAGQAHRALAYAEELQLLERVLGWWDSVPETATLVGADRATVLKKGAEAAVRAGENDRGEALVTAALAEPDVRAERVRTAAMLELRARLRARTGRPGVGDDLRRALEVAPTDHGIRPYLLNALASHLMDIPDPDGARTVALEALAAAHGTGDDPAEAGALITLATLDGHTGELDRQLPRLARAGAIARILGAHQLRLRALDRESQLLQAHGRLADAERVARDGLAAARQAGLARSAGPTHAVNLATALASAGRWDEACESVEHALDLVPPHNDHAHLLAVRAEIALHRGDVELAAQLHDLAIGLLGDDTALCQEPLLLPRLQARLRLAQGRPAEAAAVVTRALAGERLAETSRFTWPLLVTGARAAPAVPDKALAAAVRATAAAIPIATRPQAAAAATVTALSDGTPDAWASAVAVWEELGQPLELTETRLGHATALVSVGEREQAAHVLQRADLVAAELGASPLRAEIADLARRPRLRLGARPAATGDLAGRIGLTPRETEVLRLVAGGLANADIAERLFISTKTASVHVSNILGKLEVANRVEAAVAAHRLGLV